MNEVVLILASYSVFFFLNFTDLGGIFSKPLFERLNLAKTRKDLFSKVVKYSLYPLNCCYCFSFWFTLIFSKGEILLAFAAAIIALTLNTLIFKDKTYGK
jgi:hypothetical protein